MQCQGQGFETGQISGENYAAVPQLEVNVTVVRLGLKLPLFRQYRQEFLPMVTSPVGVGQACKRHEYYSR